MPLPPRPLRPQAPFSHALLSGARRASAPLVATWLAAACLAATLLLSACAVTRVEPPPPTPPPAQFKEASDGQRAGAATVPDEWWTLFQDPVLDELQRRLIVGNETLKSSVAAVASARAAYEASRRALLPTLAAGANASDTGKAQLSLTAAWEVDLWGRLSQASSGASSALQASADDLAAARLSAHALLAQTYFSLRAAEAQGTVLERSVAAYQRSLDLTQARYDGGVAARTDVLQAQTQMHTAQVQLADTRAQRAQLEHALAVLVGQAPAAFALERSAAGHELPAVPGVPTMLPSTLLQRRPDIAAAQQRVATAYAQIGVADAAYFPALTLTAGGQSRPAALATLLSAPRLAWAVGASLAQSLADSGQRQQASAQARAAADQASANYRQSVLTALQEVEDNLALAGQLEHEVQWQAEALQAAQRNLEITLNQYRGGTVSYLNVVTAQATALSSESTLLAARNRQLAAVNQLLKNVAGRWEPV